MSNLRNCSKCGRVFPFQGRNICPTCLGKEEDEFQLVRKYVRDHPGASVIEVSEQTEVEEDKILQFLRDGRLQSRGLTASLRCERCGGTISTGRFCEKCFKDISAEIKGHALAQNKDEPNKQTPKTKHKERMHVRDKGFF